MLIPYIFVLIASPVAAKVIFEDPTQFVSTGKKATCLGGVIKVSATANNVNLLYSGPANQQAATQTIVELLKVNPTIYNETAGGQSTIKGTYGIYSKLCLPVDATLAKNVQTVQFLTHGGTLDNGFWDIAPGYSYVDAAAEAGYATFLYDQIGVGKSDHPDPIQVVQPSLQVEITHNLIQFIRTGQIGDQSFKKIVGVGHGFGSAISMAITSKYPKDFDAVILTGISTNKAYLGTSLASFSLEIANGDLAGRFRELPNGYLTQATPQSIQFSYYHYPDVDPGILGSQFAKKQTITIGTLLTLGNIVTPSPKFTGPVDVVLGEKDYDFCGGDCTLPVDQSALLQPALYPAASKGSQHFLAPNAGHSFAAHYSAPKAFDHMIAFLRANGIR